MATDWLDEIEAQADDTVPYYLPRLICEIRTQRDEIARLSTALAAQPATPPASPEAPDLTREAFRAGFLAVCKRKGDTQLLDILTRVWSFDGVAAADLEPEAYEAWRAVSPVPVAPASSRPQERA